jgi:UDP-glucose 4-epimerase
MRVLVTGVAGYIGSHAAKRLLDKGHSVVGVDSLVRGHLEAVDRLARWRGQRAERKDASPPGSFAFHELDVSNGSRLARLLGDERIDTVMHFAGFTSVGESVEQPALYYEANVVATLRLLSAIDAARRARPGGPLVRLIFSSSAAVYGQPGAPGAIPESAPASPMSPYGTSKLICERAVADFTRAQRERREPFASASLRYFNVAGADPEGVVGEVHEPETHLVPLAIGACLGQRGPLTVFGDDYPTPDGTAVRDYVHVVDLVAAHVNVALDLDPEAYESPALNLGLGEGYSVMQVIDAAERVLGRPVPRTVGPRRPGDPASLVADPSAYRDRFAVHAARLDLDRQVADAAAWFESHPNGFGPTTVSSP